MNNTIVEYEGTLYIGGTYSKPNNNYGTSLKIEMELKYALMDTDRFHPSVDPHTTNRFSDLDFNSRKHIRKEYKKVVHLPFNPLFKVPKSGEYKELFDSYSDSISVRDIANIVIVATQGKIIGSVDGVDGLDGDGRKVKPWFEKGFYSTKIDVEGLCVYDGRIGTEIKQTRLINTIKDEVDSVPSSDASLRTEYDIAVYLYDSNNILIYYQLGTLSIIKKGRDSYCGRIIRQQNMIEKQHPQPLNFEFEKLIRDNVALKNIQNEFNSPIERKSSTTQKLGTDGFDREVLSFIKDTSDFFLPKDHKGTFSFVAYLDNNKDVNLFSIKSLEYVKEWSDFIKESSVYTYNNHVTEEYVFDFSVIVYLDNKKKKSTPILEYKGDLSIELESKNKTNMRISLKAKKLNTDIDRDYLPKPSVGRYNNLDY